MQKIEINKHTFKVFTEWRELSAGQWSSLKGLSSEDKPYYLTTIKAKYAYLMRPQVIDTIDKLTAHFFTHDKLTAMPVMFTGLKQWKGYSLPELVTINGNDMYLFNETAYTFCQAHDALTAAFDVDIRFIFQFAAYYLRKPGDGVSENEIIQRSPKMKDVPMSVLLEVLFHHVQFLAILTDDKHFPGLFGGKKDINGNKLEGLGFSGFLHEWAMEKQTGINDINERVNDFFLHLVYLRNVRAMK